MRKILYVFVILLLSFPALSQVILLDSVGAGGFETGTTFATNGWTVLNGASNQWAVGTGSVNAGTRGAYIGNATTFVGVNSAQYNHFYRAFTLPSTATNVRLSFRYRQPVIDAGWDSAYVSYSSSATIPVTGVVAGTGFTKVFANTLTAYAAYTSMGPYNLTSLAGSSFNLVFTYRNDGGNPIGIPAVDNISLTYCDDITAATTTVCSGQSITYANSMSGGAWSSSNTSIATVNSSGSVGGVAGGTATITYAQGTCTLTKVVTVNATPAAISGASALCVNATTTLSDATTGGAWSSSDITKATINSSGVVTGIAAGTLTMSYTISGCSAVKAMTVNALPLVFSVTGGGSGCASGGGVPVGLSGSESTISYSLSNGTSTVATATGTGSSFSFGSITSAGTYTASAVNPATGCASNMTGSATVTLTTPVIPSVSITSPSLVCIGGTGTYTASPVNGGITPTYTWYVNGANMGVSTATYSYSPVAGDIISVTLHPGGICVDPDSAVNNTTAVTSPMEIPFVTVTVNPGNPICTGALATFSATATFGGSTPSFRWTKNSVNVATGPTFSYVPSAGDIVYCMMNSSYLCRLSDSVFSSNITMMTTPATPAPTVSLLSTPGIHISAGQSDTLIAVVTSTGPVPTYQWTINGLPIAGATDASFVSNTFTNGDVVCCVVTNTDACAESTTTCATITVGPVGVDMNNAGIAALGVLPNPNRGTFAVKAYIGEVSGTAKIEIRNILGQVVYTEGVLVNNGRVESNINFGNAQPAGIYLLTLNCSSGEKTTRFVVE